MFRVVLFGGFGDSLMDGFQKIGGIFRMAEGWGYCDGVVWGDVSESLDDVLQGEEFCCGEGGWQVVGVVVGKVVCA